MQKFEMKIERSQKSYFNLVCWAILSLFIFQLPIRAERLPVKIFTSADGLGSSFVDSLFRDSRGFMWFCTRDGLSRFDGSRFVTYQVGDKNSSPGIEGIYETRDGMYWISTTGGTFRFNPNDISPPDSTTPYLKAEFMTDGRGTFFEDSQGNLWMTSGKPAHFVKGEDGKPMLQEIDFNLPPQPNLGLSVTNMGEAADGSLWLDTSWGLTRRLPDNRIVFYPKEAPVSSGNTSMIVDKNGLVWVTRADKIYIIKPEPPDFFKGTEQLIITPLEATNLVEIKPNQHYSLPKKDGEIFQFTSNDVNEFVENSYAKRIYQTSDGNVWIAAENYLLQFANGIFHLRSESEGLPNVMGQMAEDAAGNLWIGGHAGLARLDRQGLITFKMPDGTSSARFFSINEDENGTLYFAGRDFYLNRFDGNKFQSVRPAIAPQSQYLWTSRFAYRTKNGDWWILTNEKLYRFTGITDFAQLNGKKPTKTYTEADGLESNAMFQIFEDSAENIWVSTRAVGGRYGFGRLKKGTEKFQRFSENEGIPKKKAFSSAVEDSAGNIWFSFYEGGLARFDGTKFEEFSEKDGLPDGLLSDLHLDKKGRLWIGSTLGGLLRLDDTSAKNPAFAYLTTADGLTSNNIRTITEDHFDRIYVGTARGVDRLSPDTGKIKHYSVSDGLAADFVVDSHCDRNGNLWFATNDGLSRLVPLPDEKVVAPRILLGGLRIAGEPQAVSQLGDVQIEKGELSSSQNNLQIDFFGLDFRAGETLHYQYKFEGTDLNWSQPTEQRTVNLANLSPGTYRFLVRAINSEGVASENPAIVSLKILPPIYARWWFIALCILAITLIVIAFYRYRLARLQDVNVALEEARLAEEKLRKSREERLAELEKVRSRIATDLHDDIGASLTQIAILSEVAQAQSKGNGATEPLTKITNVSNELVGTMSDIVWSINPNKDHLSDLTQRMRRFAADVLSARSIGFQFIVPEIHSEITLNTNIRREVFLIFKESINNILKHSEAKQVEIELQISDKDLTLKITDDGKGFRSEPSAVADGLTLPIESVSFNLPVTEGGSDSLDGNGILNMRKRALELNGECSIISEIGKGTEVLLKLPLDAKNNLENPTQAGGDISNKKA